MPGVITPPNVVLCLAPLPPQRKRAGPISTWPSPASEPISSEFAVDIACMSKSPVAWTVTLEALLIWP